MSAEHEATQTPLNELVGQGVDRGPTADTTRGFADRGETPPPSVSERLAEARRVADELEAENRAIKAVHDRKEIIATHNEAERMRQEEEQRQQEYARLEAEVQAEQRAADPEFQKKSRDAHDMENRARGQYGDTIVNLALEELSHAIQTNHPDVNIMRQKIMAGENATTVMMGWFDATGGYSGRTHQLIAEGRQQHQQQRSMENILGAPVFPSNLAQARNVGKRWGPAWSGPTPLRDIFKR